MKNKKNGIHPIYVKRGVSSRWSFDQNFARGRIETTNSRKMHPTVALTPKELRIRIPTVKLKIPGKAFFNSESRTFVTFKL